MYIKVTQRVTGESSPHLQRRCLAALQPEQRAGDPGGVSVQGPTRSSASLRPYACRTVSSAPTVDAWVTCTIAASADGMHRCGTTVWVVKEILPGGPGGFLLTRQADVLSWSPDACRDEF